MLARLRIRTTLPNTAWVRYGADFAVAILCGVLALDWAVWVEASWMPRHLWMFKSRDDLFLDVALLNFAFGCTVYLIARALLSRLGAALATTCLVIGLAWISERKMRMLGQPLLPWDLLHVKSADAIIGFAGLSLSWGLLLIGIVALLCAAWWSQHSGKSILRRRGHLRASLLAVTLIVAWNWLVIAPETPRYLSGQIRNITWDQAGNYINYGPYYPLLSNLRFVGLIEPTQEEAQLAKGLGRDAATAMADKAMQRPHVVSLLSESFTDLPVKIFGRKFSCIPANPSKMDTPAWGGGTSNVEAEVLTGYPNFFYPPGAIPFLTHYRNPIPQAMPQVFSDMGYATFAVHTYAKSFYSRTQAYDLLGIDKYVGLEDMPQISLRGQYVDDSVLFDQILRILDSTNKPSFVNAVSMMAHSSYGWKGRYPVDEGLAPLLPPVLEPYRLALLQYASMIYDHERMLCHFLDTLRARPERVVVLFYGDHYPALGSMEVYEAINNYLVGQGVKLDIPSTHSKTPALLFDSKAGFVPLPPELPAYNSGTFLMRQAGIPLKGVWALPHKVQNQTLVDTNAPGRGYLYDPSLPLEQRVLQAHLYEVMEAD